MNQLEAKPFAFVLMPFTPDFDDIYKLGIQAAASDCDVVAQRVDEQTFSETMLDRIYRQIDVADFVIADMTGKNPNVFYEVGYAHARDKLCTLLTQSVDDIPFDLKHHRHIVYDGSIRKLKEKLLVEIEWLKEQSRVRKTSAIDIDGPHVTGALNKNEWTADAEVEFIFDLHNRTKNKSPDIEAIYFYTRPGWSFKYGADECPSTLVDDKKSLRHFIRSPVPRLSSGSWAQVKIIGTRNLWTKWSGDELKERYNLSGQVSIEIQTSDGVFKEEMNVTCKIEEVPF